MSSRIDPMSDFEDDAAAVESAQNVDVENVVSVVENKNDDAAAQSNITVVVNAPHDKEPDTAAAKGDDQGEKTEQKAPSKLDIAMEDIMVHGGEDVPQEAGGDAADQTSVFGEVVAAPAAGPTTSAPMFVFAPSVVAPMTLGAAPKEIGEAATQTSVLHQRGPCSVRDEYASTAEKMWRAITWVDQDKREGVQYLLQYDTATGKVRVAKFFASAAMPKPAPQYERTDDVLDVQRKFGPPGAAAVCLFAARDALLLRQALQRKSAFATRAPLKQEHQFAMPLLVRGPDNGWWNVMMPVIVTHSGGVRDLLRAWGGASCMEDAADVAAHLPKPTRVSIAPPKRIGQQPASISRSASSTTVAHKREGKAVKDDYAKVDARTVVRSITWNAGQESVQYIVRLDLVEATTHVAKFYVSPEPQGGVQLDWEEEMPLAEAHDRFGAPGAAASVLFGDIGCKEDANLQLQTGGGGPTAVPSCAAQIGKTRVPMAFAVSKRNIVPSGGGASAGLIKA